MTTTKARRIYAAALAALLPILTAIAIAIPAMTEAAPVGGWHGVVGDSTYRDSLPVNVPTWDAETAAAFPACERNPGDVVAEYVIVVGQDGRPARMPFAEAWERNSDANTVPDTVGANDVWVVGICRGRS